jgi:hypothetical protein
LYTRSTLLELLLQEQPLFLCLLTAWNCLLSAVVAVAGCLLAVAAEAVVSKQRLDFLLQVEHRIP